MPTYRYEADHRDGQRMSGEIAAPSRDQAIARLSLDGLSAIRILEPPTLESSADASEIVMAEIVPAERRLSLAETVDLSALAAGLTASGLPLDTGLKAAALEAPNRRLSRALLAISRRLSAGLPLDEALAAQGERLPPHVRGLVLAGLHSGRMATVLEEFVAMERHAAQLRRRVALTLAYPAVLISILFGAFAFFAAAVFPALAVILDDFDADLPAATQIAVGFSDKGVYALLGNVVVVFCAWLIIWLASDLPELCSMLKTFPLLGPICAGPHYLGSQECWRCCWKAVCRWRNRCAWPATALATRTWPALAARRRERLKTVIRSKRRCCCIRRFLAA